MGYKKKKENGTKARQYSNIWSITSLSFEINWSLPRPNQTHSHSYADTLTNTHTLACTHAHANIWEKNGCGDISLVKMSPAVGVGSLLKWHLHTFTLTHGLACSHIHGIIVYNESCQGSSIAPGGNVYDTFCRIHGPARECYGGLVFSPMLIWHQTDWDITFKARGNQPVQVRSTCVLQKERQREGSGLLYLGMSYCFYTRCFCTCW